MITVSVPDASEKRCVAISNWVEANISPLVREYRYAEQPVWREGQGWTILWSRPGGPIELQFDDERHATVFLLSWS